MRLPSSKYRGVVPQQSGKWGAQIYNQNERIWLGTFRTEVEAAKTYDIAATRIHGLHAVTNFDSSSRHGSKDNEDDDDDELKFLNSRTTTEVINMLRTHTYREEFKRSIMCKGGQINNVRGNDSGSAMNRAASESRQLLFYKVVSAADVGPQNRLLLPKQHAQDHFPCSGRGTGTTPGYGGVMINFEDDIGKLWRFRYSYWSSNGRHVLNGRWAHFAREKRLRPGDVVRFWRVTNERGNTHFFIESNNKRTPTTTEAAEQTSTVELFPISQSTEIIRLFGVDVFVNSSN